MRVGELARAVRGPGVTVRPFADRRGALIVSPTGLHIVELGQVRMTDAEAAFASAVDRAIGYQPTRVAVVRDVDDLARLTAEVRPAGR